METSLGVAAATSFLWLGMVLAISFIEAPLKFRAPGVTLPIGLGIGRLVFRALNGCELVLAVAALTGVLVGDASTGARVALGVATAALVLQLVAVRPALGRRTDAVLAAGDGHGADGPSSHAHLWYVAAEVVKVVALLVAGILVLRG